MFLHKKYFGECKLCYHLFYPCCRMSHTSEIGPRDRKLSLQLFFCMIVIFSIIVNEKKRIMVFFFILSSSFCFMCIRATLSNRQQSFIITCMLYIPLKYAKYRWLYQSSNEQSSHIIMQVQNRYKHLPSTRKSSSNVSRQNQS